MTEHFRHFLLISRPLLTVTVAQDRWALLCLEKGHEEMGFLSCHASELYELVKSSSAYQPVVWLLPFQAPLGCPGS